MIMGGDKKKIAALIVARIKPKASDMDSMKDANEKAYNERAKEGEDSGMDEGLVSAAEEVIQAVGAKDPQALAQALKDFYSMCDGNEDKEEEEEPKKDEPSILG